MCFSATTCCAHWGWHFRWWGENHVCQIDAAKFCLADPFQSETRSQGLFKGFQFQEVDRRGLPQVKSLDPWIAVGWIKMPCIQILTQNSVWPQIMFESNLFEHKTSHPTTTAPQPGLVGAMSRWWGGRLNLGQRVFLNFVRRVYYQINLTYFVRLWSLALLWQLMWALIWKAKLQSRCRHSAACCHGIEGC